MKNLLTSDGMNVAIATENVSILNHIGITAMLLDKLESEAVGSDDINLYKRSVDCLDECFLYGDINLIRLMLDLTDELEMRLK